MGLDWWPHQVSRLRHVQMLGILDHDPMVLMVQLIAPCGPARDIRQSSYFKANPTLLKNKESVNILEKAWTDHDPIVLDPRRKFSFAYDRQRSRHKEIQGELKQ